MTAHAFGGVLRYSSRSTDFSKVPSFLIFADDCAQFFNQIWSVFFKQFNIFNQFFVNSLANPVYGLILLIL